MSLSQPEAPSAVVRRKVVSQREQGAFRAITSGDVIRAASLVQAGRVYDLGLERYRGMPLPAIYPPFEIMTYRSPRGIRNQGDHVWPGSNQANVAWNSEIVLIGTHVGTHFDSLAHLTIGEDDHWYGGFRADQDLGDFGPLHADASTIPPIFARGVLLDVAGMHGVEALEGHSEITRVDLERTIEAQRSPIERGDVVLIRTGYLGVWPDHDKIAEHAGAGINLEAARWLADQGCVIVGADTEAVEQLPSADSANPHPVHSFLLIERGVLMLELADLELLAADGFHTFLFVGLPIKIRGATGGLLDPIAVV